MRLQFIIFLLVAVTLFGCGKGNVNKDTKEEESIQTTLQTEETEVRTKILRSVDFEHELVSNGRLSTQSVAELQFESLSSNSVPIHIFVKNGDRVAAGAPIAMLDTFNLANSLKSAENDLKKAKLEFQDALIGMGYSIDDINVIPQEAEELANIRSGYNSALNQYELAKHNLEEATLRTPISGTVVDLFSKPYCVIDGTAAFCKVINNSMLDVDFTILENELPLIKVGDKVQIQSYASSEIQSTGNIININPSVGKDGTVRIRASVNAHQGLFNGMNVRISVFRSAGKQLVVPKSAVVLRTGKQVVFTYNNDGTAAWNYVKTGLENATQYTVTSETLKEGDEVIYSGNEHLADGTKVKKIED